MIAFAEFGEEAPVLQLQHRRVKLTQHWVQGGQLAAPLETPEAGLHLQPDGLVVFTAAMKPGPNDFFKRERKEFVSGLWKGNVVELFLLNPDNGHYLEVHLSPTGQWWACVFTAVRVQESQNARPLPLSVVRHHRDKTGRRWEASVQVPSTVVCRLLAARDFMKLRANLTAVVHPLTGRALYFSLAALPGMKPDFHQPEAWLPLC
jgi:hypothetical protein